MVTSPRERRLQGWICWTAAACFYFYQFILRVSPSVMGPDLMRDFHIDAYDLGWFSGLYYFSYSLLQIPIGIALDLYGPRRVLLSAVGVSLAGTFLFSVADSMTQASIGRLLIGAGSACGFLGTIKIASSWFRPSLFAVLVGVTSFIGVIGAMVGSAPLAVLVGYLGWRQAMTWLMFLGLVVTVGLVLGVRDNSKDHHERTPSGFLDVLIRPQIWLVGFLGLALYSPITVVADLWGTQFLASHFGIPSALAASSVSLIYIGFGLGAFVVGWISHGLKDWRRFFLLTALGLAAILCSIIWLPDSFLGIVTLLMLLLGFLSAGECLIFPAACRQAPIAYSGTVTGFVNMFTMLGGTLLQPLVGYVMRSAWSGRLLDGLPVYSSRDYQVGLSVVLLLLAAAAGCTFLIRDLQKSETVTGTIEEA
jgi:predicted MFS family arabinose efflux permease